MNFSKNLLANFYDIMANTSMYGIFLFSVNQIYLERK